MTINLALERHKPQGGRMVDYDGGSTGHARVFPMHWTAHRVKI